MKEVENWTDEELIQVYDLQKKYAEKVVDFVRHTEENEVYKFLKVIPELHNYDNSKALEQEIYNRNEIMSKEKWKERPRGRYIYKDLFEKWKGADSLREIFEEKYQWDFEEGQPKDLAIFAGNREVALENYSAERYEKLREEIPQELQKRIKNLMMDYPQEIKEKALKVAVYGYTNAISNIALLRYSNEHMPEFEKAQWLIQQEDANTIVGAYDLQAGLKIYQSTLDEEYLTSAVRNFKMDKKVFEIVYGEKSAELLNQADEKVIKLASQYDFINTEEKFQVLENHKICLFGTAEEKLKIPYKNDPFCISDKDLEIILEEETKKYEQEGFSKKYYPNGKGHREYSNQSYKVVGRVKANDELQPQWNIIFEDGKIITAQADEIISSQINERFYGEQAENFGNRPISKVLIVDDKEKMNLFEGQEKISAIINQLRKNGESVNKLKDILEFERKNLTYAR